MNKFFETIKNIFKIEELRNRILYTLLLLVVFRLGCSIVLPGIDPSKLQNSGGTVFGMLDNFLGGAFLKGSIFALGIMPYISASIIIQLLQVAVPSFQKMQKDGEAGRKRLNQITRILTIGITLAQSTGYLTTTVMTQNPGAITINPTFFIIQSMILITTGTIFCMWLGERITERGIGNGISMLIMIGIVSRFPTAIVQETFARSNGVSSLLIFMIEVVVLFFVVLAVIALTQAVRKIPVEYARQAIGNKVYGGQRQYIPIKVNSAGVMPIIFAQALMFIPALVPTILPNNDYAMSFGAMFNKQTTFAYSALFAFLIIIFTYFYTAIQVDPVRISEDIKRGNGFIPGVKPGQETTDYIDNILSLITFPGAIFLAVLAILPAFAEQAGIQQEFAQFFGGTSLLIMVGVILDTLQQINGYLLSSRYDGLMETEKVQGEAGIATVA
jgi:preprotein translocase subunit SecY